MDDAADLEELGELAVHDVAEAHRYELRAGDRVVAYADYVDHGGVVELPHTVVDPGLRGRGLGDVLVAGVLADLSVRGLDVQPTCWFVADHLQRHPRPG